MTNKNQHIPSGYKPSPLGIIPEDWEVKRLGEACTFLSTNTLSRNQLNDTNGEVRNIHYGDVLIKYPSIIDVRKQSIPFVNQEDYKESMNDFIEDGDVVLADTAEDGTVGKACEIANVGSEKILSGLHTMLIRPQKGLFSPWFLGYQVNSVSYRKQLNALVQGIKVCSLGKQAIANTYFAIPPSHEQQSIVSVLSLWDTAIAKQTALIEKLALRKRGLMQQLLTGKKRLKWFGGGSFQAIPFDRIAKTINVKPFQISKSDYQDCGSTPVVDQGQSFIAAYIDTKNVFTDTPFVLFGDHTRIVKWIDFPCVIGADGVQAIKSKEEMDIKYLYYLLSNTELPNLGYSRHMSILKEKMFYVTTNYDEQKAIAECLSNADKEIGFAKERLLYLQKQKQGLMQVLLSGKRRIKL